MFICGISSGQTAGKWTLFVCLCENKSLRKIRFLTWSWTSWRYPWKPLTTGSIRGCDLRAAVFSSCSDNVGDNFASNVFQSSRRVVTCSFVSQHSRVQSLKHDTRKKTGLMLHCNKGLYSVIVYKQWSARWKSCVWFSSFLYNHPPLSPTLQLLFHLWK